MICPQFKPIVGGYERAAERLSIELTVQNHDITIITEKRDKCWQKKEELEGVIILRLWCIYKPKWHSISSLVSFSFYLLTQGFKFHVWHVHQYGMHAVLAVLLGKLLRRPVVLKLTNSKEQGLNKVINGLPLNNLLHRILQGVNAVVALSRETRNDAIAFGIPIDRIHVLGNGVDTLKYTPCEYKQRKRLQQKLGIDAIGVVIYIGRLSNEKNLQGLLKAWRIAIPQLPDGWKLIIVGDGPLRAILDSEILTYKLSTSVQLVGQQNNIHEWLGAADIYTLASHNEGLSNTLLEAMACGRPVVSTLVSGVTELVLETGAGFVVAIGNMNQLATSIVKLAKNPKLQQQMGQNSRKAIEKKYSIESVTTSYANLYRDLTEK